MKTCPTTMEYMSEVDYSIDGHDISFHHIALIICALFGVIAIVVSAFLMHMHASHYSKPWEQRHIIRILFMVPVYALVSFLSFFYYRYAVYWELIRDCYEAFAIASFFTLMCHYVAPNLHDQKAYFRNLQPKNWVFPVPWVQKCTGGQNKGFLRKPKSGLTWFNVVWVGIFQYCFIRPIMTVVAVGTQAVGLYCIDSLSPEYSHIWTTVINSIAVTFAMYFLIQFYVQMKGDLAPHKPFLKLLSIKLVIFFCFWQTLVISFLASSSGPLHPTDHIGRPDIVVGIPSLLLCIEMAGFAVMHIFAYPYMPYKLGSNWSKPIYAQYDDCDTPDCPKKYQGGFLGFWAYLDAFNPWDILKSLGRGGKWLFVGRRYRHDDISYHETDSTKLDHIRTDSDDVRSNRSNSDEFKPLASTGAAPAGRAHGDSEGYAYQPAYPPAYPSSNAYAGGKADISGRTNGGADGYSGGYENFQSPTYAQAPTQYNPAFYRPPPPPSGPQGGRAWS